MGSAKPALGVQRRMQAELARLGFDVCARTVARYMRRPYSGTPSPGWRRIYAEVAAIVVSILLAFSIEAW